MKYNKFTIDKNANIKRKFFGQKAENCWRNYNCDRFYIWSFSVKYKIVFSDNS